MHYYIQDSCILTLSYPGFRLDQLGSKLEDIAITTIILCPCCQQPFLIKMAGDNQLSAATSKFLLLLLNLLPTWYHMDFKIISAMVFFFFPCEWPTK